MSERSDALGDSLEDTLKRPSARPDSAPGGAPASAFSRLMALFRRNKRAVQAVAVLVIAVFVAIAIWKSWSNLQGYQWNIQWGLLVTGFLLLVAQELSFALIWRSILRRLGSRLDITSAERIYLGAEFVRYIPGNVWHVITRVLWAEQKGVAKPIGFASMVIELATKILSAALVFAVTLLFWPNLSALSAQAHIPQQVAIIAGAVAVPLLLLGLYPPLLERALNAGLKLLKREPTHLSLRYIDLLVISLLWGLSWVVAGVGFYLIIRSIVSTPMPATAIILAVGIYALGWDIGFLSFITPSGIGFRELAIAFLLVWGGMTVGPGAFALGVVIAFISRLLSTGSELASIGVAYLLSDRQIPTPPAPGGAL
ncbi:MAG TPA: lysylphosphatidylglycerol synthase transmembrane domain-containing protein [Ktedonobacterales bacterium]